MGADRDEISLVVAIDDRYVPHFATSIASVAASRGPEAVRFFVLQGPTLSAHLVSLLRDFARELGMDLEAIPISGDVAASVPKHSYYPPIIWYRLLVPELLTDLDRALVLDADLLVLQSVWPLHSYDLGTNPLAAVGTSVARVDAERLRSLGIDPDAPYLNTGVMVMDLEAMRAEEIGSRALAWAHSQSHELKFPEQDSLNFILEGGWNLLHPRWNAMSHLWFRGLVSDATYTALERETARQSPAIVHFEGHPTVKPWCYRSSHPLRFLYRDLRATTPWPLDAGEGKSLTGAVLRHLPPGLQYALAREKRRVIKSVPRRADRVTRSER